MASARALELDHLYRLQLVGDPQLSPDGTRVVFVQTVADRESDENRSSLWLVDVDGDDPEPRRLTNGPADAAPRWTPDGDAVLFVRKGAGADKAQVWRLPLHGGEPMAVTSLEQGVSSFVLSPDGSRLVVAALVDLAKDRPAHAPVEVDRLQYQSDGAGLLGTRRSHLFLVDLHGGADGVRQLTEGDSSCGGPAWSPDGNRIAYVTAGERDDRDLKPGSAVLVLDLDGDAPARRITAEEGSAAGLVWLDDRTILFAGKGSPAPGHARLHTVDADSGAEPVELTPGFDRNVMLGAPAYPGSLPRLAGDDVVFCARERGCTHVYRVAKSGGAPQRVAGAADATASSDTDDAGGRRMAFISGPTSSTGDLVVADAPSGAHPRTLTGFAHDGVDRLTPTARSFTAPDGTEVHGWVLRDRSTEGAGPLLLDVHGGPHNAWNPTFDGIHLYHQVLARQGWTILYVNPRGSDGYGERFYTAVVEGWGTSDTDDFLAPIDALVAEGLADPDRLAVTGYSYGGFMTCWLTSRTDRFAAAIAGGSVTNQVSMFGSSDAGFFLGAIEVGGTPADPKALHEQSPITYVGDVTAPTLILHGERDDRCPIEQAEQWFAALRAQGVPTRMVRYPGGSHLFIALGRPSHRLDYNRRVVEWLNEHVPVS
jgi:dipeptidyl aminopeptidase/acylaminoacyl peptidase